MKYYSQNEKSKVRAGMFIAERKAAVANAEARGLRNRLRLMDEGK